MKSQIKTLLAVLILAGLTATAVQTQEQPKPNPDVKHFAKDGFSFDYPTGWDITDQSTAQLQYLSLSRAGYAGIMVRSPRAGIDSKKKKITPSNLFRRVSSKPGPRTLLIAAQKPSARW